MTTNVHLLCEHLTNNGFLGDTVPNAPQEGVVNSHARTAKLFYTILILLI